MITNFFSPLCFVAVFGSGIRDPGWVNIRIRDKHPGSTTLISNTDLNPETQMNTVTIHRIWNPNVTNNTLTCVNGEPFFNWEFNKCSDRSILVFLPCCPRMHL